ncbi:uncharacterized protein N7484_007083 [Penicillium longicatenatum]|uniref:uncharacterized protein n=1 Tax=Penicillium longicatenatum TaxID=1561947 RepID=UPI002548835A|nr:uncharacterized protein N7484_007083 [Penicillium longicatenatum]KAJ5639221.1 hypothetical protein N7484_007083 [Penicillium longicatenatum]KAJ5651879.1 hypothetical protein N7507_009305 [Penicillium longicatenatum]
MALMHAMTKHVIIYIPSFRVWSGMGDSDARDGNPMKGAPPLLLQRDTAANEDPLGYSATHPVVDLIALLKGCDSLIPLLHPICLILRPEL